MVPNILSFLISRIVAVNAGESVDRANQLALVGSLIKSPLFGAVLVQTIAQKEVQSSAPATPPPVAATPPSSSDVVTKAIEMPTLQSTARKTRILSEARKTLKEKGFPPPIVLEHFVPTADPNVVLVQDPFPATRVIPAETEVTLTVTPSSEHRGVGDVSQSY
jgi:hypothetical protein